MNEDVPLPESSRARSPWQRISFVVIALITGAAIWWAYGHWDWEAFDEWQRHAHPFPFFAALAILPAIGFPTTPFYLIAGATFGLGTSLIGAGLSIFINQVICYWVARTFLRKWIVRLLRRIGYSIPRLNRTRAFDFSVMVKIAPGPPAFLKSYVIAVAGVPFEIFVVVSWVITFAYAVAFIVLGESLFDRDWQQTLWSVVALVALGVFFYGYRRRRARVLAAEAPEK